MINLAYHPVPSQFPYSYSYPSSYGRSNTATMIVMICSILLLGWEFLIIIFNLEMILSLFQHPSFSVVLFFSYFFIDASGKLCNGIIGLISSINAAVKSSFVWIFLPYFINLACYILFVILAWKKFTIGIDMASSFGMLLQTIIIIFIYFIGDANPRYRYMMVPKL